jgi:FAD:protein FMN transferase
VLPPRLRYSHIVDPRTGIGLTDHSSVTVIAPDGITADGMATAVNVMGPEKGLNLVDQTPGTAALIVRAPEGKPQTYQSSRWEQLSGAPPAPE